jgi:hypothetical protein
VADLSEVDCLNDFCFCKDDSDEFIQLLKKPMGHELIYVEGSDDMVKVKHWYTIPYETGILMILYRLARPQRVRCNLERKFACRRARCSAVCVCGTFIDALHEISLPYLTNAALFQTRRCSSRAFQSMLKKSLTKLLSQQSTFGDLLTECSKRYAAQ